MTEPNRTARIDIRTIRKVTGRPINGRPLSSSSIGQRYCWRDKNRQLPRPVSRQLINMPTLAFRDRNFLPSDTYATSKCESTRQFDEASTLSTMSETQELSSTSKRSIINRSRIARWPYRQQFANFRNVLLFSSKIYELRKVSPTTLRVPYCQLFRLSSY